VNIYPTLLRDNLAVSDTLKESLKTIRIDLSRPQPGNTFTLLHKPQTEEFRALSVLNKNLPNLEEMIFQLSDKVAEQFHMVVFYHFLSNLVLPPYSGFKTLKTWTSAFAREVSAFNIIAEDLDIEVLTVSVLGELPQ
jgi:hypothetical protein